MAIIRTTIAETIQALSDETARLNGGTLEIHGGGIPADGDVAVSAASALVTFTLPDPAFQSPTDGGGFATATANPIADASATASGTATHAVFRDNGGSQLHIVDVTLLAGNGFVRLDDLAIAVSEAISVTTGAWRRNQNST